MNDPVKIPQGKTITYKHCGETDYVQHETGRRYDRNRKYTLVDRVVIGLRMPDRPDMMLPNENYQKYFPNGARDAGKTGSEESIWEEKTGMKDDENENADTDAAEAVKAEETADEICDDAVKAEAAKARIAQDAVKKEMAAMKIKEEAASMMDDAEKYRRERDKRNTLRELFEQIFYEFQIQSRKKPGAIVNECKARTLNQVLSPLMEMMQGMPCAEFLRLVDLPETTVNEDGSETVTGMSHSDTALLMTQYKGLMNQYFMKHF